MVRRGRKGSRWAYTFHVIKGQNEYNEKNWLQPKERADGFTRPIEDVAESEWYLCFYDMFS